MRMHVRNFLAKHSSLWVANFQFRIWFIASSILHAKKSNGPTLELLILYSIFYKQAILLGFKILKSIKICTWEDCVACNTAIWPGLSLLMVMIYDLLEKNHYRMIQLPKAEELPLPLQIQILLIHINCLRSCIKREHLRRY